MPGERGYKFRTGIPRVLQPLLYSVICIVVSRKSKHIRDYPTMDPSSSMTVNIPPQKVNFEEAVSE